MINLKPKSSLGLLLLAFLIVTLPLIAGHGRALLFVDQISTRSDEVVARGVHLVSETSTLADDLTGLQRHARQYQVIGEAQLVERFDADSAAMLARLASIRNGFPESANDDTLDILEARIIGARAGISRHESDSPELQELVDSLARLSIVTPRLEAEANRYVRDELKALDDATTTARRRLLLQASAMIPATVLLVLFFSFVVERPMRQMGRAIRALGEGDLNKTIDVRGPREVEHLGRELDWLRARLVESEEEKSQFLRRVSHELKTPLASIREGAELLSEESLGNLSGDQKEVATLVRESSIDLQRQIENLLSFNLRDALDAAVHITEFSLRQLVDEIRERHRLPLTANNLVLDFESKVETCRADREKVRIALDNLITNAVRYSPDNSIIEVSARRGRGQTVIEVNDQGPGVPQSERDFIFRPFFQGTSSSSKKHVRGTGIGLSVARESITTQGGTLTLQNSRRGARFRITLPDMKEDTKCVERPELSPQASPLSA